MEPEHTYWLPSRARFFGALAENADVIALLERAWARYGREEPGPFEGASFLPNAGKVRLSVSRDGEFDVFDVDAKTLEKIVP